MQTAYTKEELRSLLAPVRGSRVVLVPTMGALHEGHATLLRQARELAGEAGVVVASVFLNPVQFDNAGDLATYPKTPQQDLEICAACGVMERSEQYMTSGVGMNTTSTPQAAHISRSC